VLRHVRQQIEEVVPDLGSLAIDALDLGGVGLVDGRIW
jgi:hypothetical protein